MSAAVLSAQARDYQGKAVYLAHDLDSIDFNNPDSKWSFSRMASTENIVVFWAKPFGDNLAAAPALEGQDMTVDLNNILNKLERFYRFYRNDLGWVKPDSTLADKYKMMLMIDYSLEGTAYGGDYDQTIGALWCTPSRLKDPTLNCVAHELGHSFQSQISSDGQGEAWGGNGIFEMTSQWMLWQVNPDWQTDENYHLKAYQNLTHKAFLHFANIYHSPYVLEAWGEMHGRPFIAEMFRQGRVGEDPVMTYKRMTGLGQEEFNDEMYHQQARFVNWDFDRVRQNAAPYRNQWHTPMDTLGTRHYRIPVNNAPENYGFNFVELQVPAPGKTISVDFKGLPKQKGYSQIRPENAGWRYGLIAVDTEGNAHYEPMHREKKGTLSYTPSQPLSHLWLMVMGAPTEHWQNPGTAITGDSTDAQPQPDAQWPYEITLKGTDLK